MALPWGDAAGAASTAADRSAAADHEPYRSAWTHVHDYADHDRPAALVPTDDGAHLLVNYTATRGPDRTRVIRVSAEGRAVWERTSGVEDYDKPLDGAARPDGGVLVVGTTQELVRDEEPGRARGFLFGVGPHGTVDVRREFTHGDDALCTAIARVGEARYLLFGRVLAHDEGPFGIYYRLVDDAGSVIDGGTYEPDGIPEVAAVGPAGDVLVGGRSFAKEPSVAAMKVGADGSSRWLTEATLPDTPFVADGAPHPRGGLVVLYRLGDTHQLTYIDDAGDQRWTRAPDAIQGRSRSVVRSPVGGLFVGGREADGDERPTLTSLTAEGEVEWSTTVGPEEFDAVEEIVVGQAGDLVVAGRAWAHGEDVLDIYVGSLENRPPDLEVRRSTSNPTAGVPLTLDAGETADPEFGVASIAWDPDGDGHFETTGQTLEYTFDTAGLQEVDVRVTDTAGRTGTQAITVAVSTPAGGTEGATDAERTDATSPGVGLGTGVAGLALGAAVERLRER